MKLLPSLKQLEYLVALDDTQHFGKAAGRCHITPSTLSAGIRDLEGVLGVALAERTKRHVLMTPLGEELARRARLLLRDAGDIMALAASNRDFLTGDLRLGVIPTVGPFLLPRVLPMLNAKYPALRLYLREERTQRLLVQLRDGTIDAALIALPHELEGLESRVLFEDGFAFACHRDHPLAGKKTISVRALAAQPLLLLEDGHCLRGHALEACGLSDRSERSQFEASSLHTLVQMVSGGIGVTLLPQLAIDSRITAGTNIELVRLSKPAARQIGLVWRSTSLRGAEFVALADELKAPSK